MVLAVILEYLRIFAVDMSLNSYAYINDCDKINFIVANMV